MSNKQSTQECFSRQARPRMSQRTLGILANDVVPQSDIDWFTEAMTRRNGSVSRHEVGRFKRLMVKRYMC